MTRFLGFVASTAATFAALTADAQAQSPTWSGFYVGAAAGFANEHARATTDVTCPPGGFNCAPAFPGSLANGRAIARDGTGDLGSKGFIGAALLGQNFQLGNVVLGYEGDYGTFNFDRSFTRNGRYPFDVVPGGTNYSMTTAIDSDWLATLRGRIGFVAGSMLLYATGGVAFTELKVTQTFQDTLAKPGRGDSSASIQHGFVFGGGAEWRLSPNWIVRGEYLHVSFNSPESVIGVAQGGNVPVGTAGSVTLSLSGDVSADIVRAAAIYKF